MDNESSPFDERFAQLPKMVQDAIVSADVEQHLQELSKKHQLHLDQWQELETEVMASLMGIKSVSELEQNIKTHVRVDDATAHTLAESISNTVFAPVREELERFFASQQTAQAEGTPIVDMSDQILKDAGLRKDISTPQTEAKPGPAPVAAQTVARKEMPETYKTGQLSTERKDVRTDPYRISPDA